MAPSNPSPKVRTVLTWIQAGNNQDFNAMAGQMDDSYQHNFHPKSIGKGALNKRAYIDHAAQQMKMVRNFNMSILDVIESDDKVVVDMKVTGLYPPNTQLNHEAMLIVTFNNSLQNPKIRMVKEFSDSASYARFLPKLDSFKAANN